MGELLVYLLEKQLHVDLNKEGSNKSVPTSILEDFRPIKSLNDWAKQLQDDLCVC